MVEFKEIPTQKYHVSKEFPTQKMSGTDMIALRDRVADLGLFAVVSYTPCRHKEKQPKKALCFLKLVIY